MLPPVKVIPYVTSFPSTFNAPNVPVDADTSKLIAKSVNFCLIKLVLIGTVMFYPWTIA